MYQNRLAAALAGLLMVTGGCQKPDERLDQAEKRIESWYATLSLTDEQWARGQVPSVYLKQLAEAAEQSLDEQAKTIRSAQGGDATRAARLLDSVAFVRDRARGLRSDAEGGR